MFTKLMISTETSKEIFFRWRRLVGRDVLYKVYDDLIIFNCSWALFTL
jgi:hypothetical protein